MILKVIIIVTGTAWIYYRSWVAVILLIPAGVWYYIQLLDECIKRKEQEFLVQFKELIQTFSSLLNTGYSVENAVKESLKEMQVFYSDDAAILRELEIMVRQIRVQVPVEQAVEELSERTKLPDVESFAGVFVTAKRSGGNLMSAGSRDVEQHRHRDYGLYRVRFAGGCKCFNRHRQRRYKVNYVNNYRHIYACQQGQA